MSLHVAEFTSIAFGIVGKELLELIYNLLLADCVRSLGYDFEQSTGKMSVTNIHRVEHLKHFHRSIEFLLRQIFVFRCVRKGVVDQRLNVGQYLLLIAFFAAISSHINIIMNIDEVKSKTYVYFLAVNCVLGSFLFGYQMMVIGCLQKLIIKFNHLEQDSGWYIGMVNAALALGALIGCLLVNRLLSILGARRLLVLMDIGTLVFIFVQMLDLSLFVLVFSRFFLGIIIGINSSVIPTYLLSLTPPSMAGATGSLNQLFITIGIAIAYIVGFWITPQTTIEGNQWRYVLFVPVFTCMIRTLSLIFCIPFDLLDRHYQLGQKHFIDKYCQIVYKNIDGKTLVKQLKFDKPKTSSYPGSISYSSSYKKRFLLALVVGLSGQFSGINAILFYAKSIFLTITDDNDSKSQMYCLGLGLLQTFVTLISGLFIDKCGKRTFMLTGLTMILATLLTLFIIDQIDIDRQIPMIVLIFFHIVGFSLSLGPIIWIYISQILKQQSIIICCIWIMTFLTAISTQTLIDTAGFGVVCAVYFVLELLACIYIYFNLKQTSGKSLRQIEQLFESGSVRQDLQDQSIRHHEN